MSYTVKTSEQVGMNLLEEEQEAHDNPRVITGFASYGRRTGSDAEKFSWKRLDQVTRGVHKNRGGQGGAMTVLGGRPKSGKSMLVATWTPNIARQCPDGHVVRVITLEMDAEAYQRRMAAIIANVPDPIRIESGHLTTEERQRYHAALAHIMELPIEYYDEPMDFGVLSAIITASGKPKPPKTFWWVLDNFGLLRDLDGGKNAYGGMVSLANNVQMLCQRSATGMIVTHLNRASVGKRPSLESVAGTDQISRNADELLLLWRRFQDADIDPKILETGEPGELVCISRNRAGGIVPLWWEPTTAHYKELTIEEAELMDSVLPVVEPKKRGR